jgi:RTA1 like protein
MGTPVCLGEFSSVPVLTYKSDLRLTISAFNDPDTHWSRYCPSWPAAIVFCSLFGVTLVLHIAQAIYYKKVFLWVLIMGATWEFIAAATRVVSIQNPKSKPDYEVSFIFLVLAPLWINAFDYIVLGRLIWFYIPEKQLAGIKATRLAAYFVLMDITSFIIQLAGALVTTNNNSTNTLNGLHVYTAGVCLQEAVILVFFALSLFFFKRLRMVETEKDKSKGVKLVILLLTSLILISVRCV